MWQEYSIPATSHEFHRSGDITLSPDGAPDLTYFLAQERILTSPYYNSRFFSTLSPIFRLIIGKAYE
jgi:hypothetical protein